MLRTIFGTTLIVVTSTSAFCQSAAAPPAFEVASVRVSQGGRVNQGGRGLGLGFRPENIQVTPGSVTMRNSNLKSAIGWAYHVMDYQVSGPDWLQSERYDIVAKAAGPATEEQLRPMMQTLLAERFKLELHHQTKELPAYVLLVAKNGPKFHESETEGESAIQPDQKRMSVTVQRTPLLQLVELLSNIFRAPVVDMTGLTGRYDITINLAKYISEMQPVPGGAPPDPLSLITMGLQEEFGLKLESKKVSLDLLIIDRAEKAPVEN
jgi:uncharacterized protein (TIGR03435 family)